jgi:hypothetical protein
MAKFGSKTEDDVVAKEDMTPPSTPAATTVTTTISTPPSAPAMMTQAQTTGAAQLAQAEIDAKIADENIKKQEEHWVKAYWRPSMGWLYMAMCAFDFIIFPILSMMLPIIMKIWKVEMAYVAWKSLTLDNGGLIHLAFGAILGVAAWSRGQEKVASKA